MDCNKIPSERYNQQYNKLYSSKLMEPLFPKTLECPNKNINDQKTQQKLETLEKNMKNQSGPLDYDLRYDWGYNFNNKNIDT